MTMPPTSPRDTQLVPRVTQTVPSRRLPEGSRTWWSAGDHHVILQIVQESISTALFTVESVPYTLTHVTLVQ